MKKNNFKQTEIGMIPEDWAVRTAGEFVDIEHGYAFKGEFFTDIPNGNILLTPGNFKIGGGFKKDKLKYTKEESPKDYVLKEGDIIVTMTDLSKEGDTLGYSAKVPASKGEKYLHNQRIGLLKFKSKEISPDFMYWILRTKKYNFFVVGSATGSTVKHTSPNRIKQFIFGMPINVTEQQSIASILGSLDSKIALNRSMNSTLESIGQALFKHWFVDFEFPNEEGKPYKSSGGEMMETDIGEVPKGWRVGKISDFGRIVCGKTPSKSNKEYFEGIIPFIKIPDMHNDVFVIKTEDSLTEKGKKFQENKTIPANSVCVSCIATVGLVCITDKDSQTNQQINSIVPEKSVYTYYLYYNISSMREFLKILGSGGSATLNINTGNFSNIDILIPSNEVLQKFHSTLNSSFMQIKNNLYQNENMSKIRDALLPKLMSGEIRVPANT
ncbi:MAG: restriction endonuclease subunit S [Nanoarchaeota archaeon]